MRGLEPPVSCRLRSRSDRTRISSARSRCCRLLRRHVGREVGDRGQPVFQLGVEARLRPAGLQVEEAEHQRTGEAEERGREGRAHAGERRGKAGLQRVEHGGRVAGAGIERLDRVADRADRGEQAPERAEQAEEDQQADEIARHVAALVEPRGDRIQHRAHGVGGQRGGGRRLSRPFIGASSTGSTPIGAGAERVDPADFAEQTRDLREGQQDADDQNAEDQPVQARIGGEGASGSGASGSPR